MKNVLTYRNETIMLLANVDDGTNRLFINDEEIPSSQWVGTGNYTKTIDGVTISITKIANLSGNIVLKKVTDTSFRLVKKAEALQQSYIGMITTSTTLDTLEKVREVFGSDTTWIQHSGYMLRGAASGVVANSAAKTGGNDNAIIPYHRHGIPALSGSTNSNGYVLNTTFASASNEGYSKVGGVQPGYFGGQMLVSIGAMNAASQKNSHTVTIPASNTNYNGEDVTNKNIPNYKSVYIWERVS